MGQFISFLVDPWQECSWEVCVLVKFATLASVNSVFSKMVIY